MGVISASSPVSEVSTEEVSPAAELLVPLCWEVPLWFSPLLQAAVLSTIRDAKSAAINFLLFFTFFILSSA